MKFLYTVLDTVKAEINQPFLANNDAHAVRIHQQSLKEVPVDFHGEMKLLCIGEINVETGYLHTEGFPVVVNVSLGIVEED